MNEWKTVAGRKPGGYFAGTGRVRCQDCAGEDHDYVTSYAPYGSTCERCGVTVVRGYRPIGRAELLEAIRHGYVDHHGSAFGVFVLRDPAGRNNEPVELAFGPADGDLVRVGSSEYYAAEPGDMAMVTHVYGRGEGMCGVCLKYRAHRPGDGSYVSVSGGPIPAVYLSDLSLRLEVGTARYWRWGPHGQRAGGGVDYVADTFVWGWNGIDAFKRDQLTAAVTR